MKYLLKNFFHAIVPAFLLTLPVGSVYAFSYFSSDMALLLNCPMSKIQFAFTLSIFFLGLGASFFGPIVEKHIKLSALIGSFLYISGLLLTSYALTVESLPLLYLGYGFLCGIAQGCIYLTPVKNLILWNKKMPGLASAISIVSFGLGSSFCVFLASKLYNVMFANLIFICLAIVYSIMMLIGILLIKRPENYIATTTNTDFSYLRIFNDKFFWQSWLFMFLNISCGLVLIGTSKNIFEDILTTELVTIFLMLCGLFNGAFRLVFATITDFLKNKLWIWIFISALSFISMIISSIYYPALAVIILLINSTYGGGFSTCPPVLLSHYGKDSLSKIHGLVLSAWGLAALPAFVINYFIFSKFNNFSILTIILACIYLINVINTVSMYIITKYGRDKR